MPAPHLDRPPTPLAEKAPEPVSEAVSSRREVLQALARKIPETMVRPKPCRAW